MSSTAMTPNPNSQGMVPSPTRDKRAESGKRAVALPTPDSTSAPSP